jgi:hypothetical protein
VTKDAKVKMFETAIDSVIAQMMGKDSDVLAEAVTVYVIAKVSIEYGV